MLLLAYAGDSRAKAKHARRARGVRGSPRLAFILTLRDGVASRSSEGDVDLAADDAREALALSVDDRLPRRRHQRSRRASTSRRAGSTRRSRARGSRAPSRLQLSGLDLPYGVGGLALAEAHLARGDGELADAALARVIARLDAVARTVGASEAIARFAARKLPNDRITSMARERGLRTLGGLDDVGAAASDPSDRGAA